ncbi:MAG: divalent-cation tolerance protein CutA [Pseudomonadota bacterium]
MSDAPVVLYVTAPDDRVADTLARALVDERLAACVNVLPAGRSFFRWDGAVQANAECVLLVKTVASRQHAARARILALHPYDTPCVLAFPADPDGSAPAFVRWLADETTPPGE